MPVFPPPLDTSFIQLFLQGHARKMALQMMWWTEFFFPFSFSFPAQDPHHFNAPRHWVKHLLPLCSAVGAGQTFCRWVQLSLPSGCTVVTEVLVSLLPALAYMHASCKYLMTQLKQRFVLGVELICQAEVKVSLPIRCDWNEFINIRSSCLWVFGFLGMEYLRWKLDWACNTGSRLKIKYIPSGL